MAENEGFVWTTGKKVAAGAALLFVMVFAYIFLHKPAPKTYTKGAKAPANAPNPVAAAAAKIQQVAAPKNNPMQFGSTGVDVSAFQDDLGELGNGITVNATFDQDTLTAYQQQCAAWGVPGTLPITLSDWRALLSTQTAKTEVNQVAAESTSLTPGIQT